MVCDAQELLVEVAGVPLHLAVVDIQAAIRTLHLSGVSRSGTGDGYPKVVSLTADNAFEGNRQVVIQQALSRAGISQPGPVWLVTLRAMFVALEHLLQHDGHTCNDRLELVSCYLGYDHLATAGEGLGLATTMRDWALPLPARRLLNGADSTPRLVDGRRETVVMLPPAMAMHSAERVLEPPLSVFCSDVWALDPWVQSHCPKLMQLFESTGLLCWFHQALVCVVDPSRSPRARVIRNNVDCIYNRI